MGAHEITRACFPSSLGWTGLTPFAETEPVCKLVRSGLFVAEDLIGAGRAIGTSVEQLLKPKPNQGGN